MLKRLCRIPLLLCLALTSISMVHAQDIELPESEAYYTAVFPSLEFSFDYADHYMGMRAEENRIMLQWRDSYTLGLSIVPVLTITVDESQPLDDVVDAIIDDLNLVDPTIIDDELDGVPVKIMEAKVYASRWRWLLINQNDRLYTFEILPADEPTMPTESRFADKLWDDTINSLKFDDLPEFDADCEDDSEFVEDITIPDGMHV